MEVSFSIRLTDTERALFEKIEDEYDIALADEAYEEYLANPTTYSHEEFWNDVMTP